MEVDYTKQNLGQRERKSRAVVLRRNGDIYRWQDINISKPHDRVLCR